MAKCSFLSSIPSKRTFTVPRIMYCPQFSREKVLEQIGLCLKGTRKQCLIIKPNIDLNIDCHVVSNFTDLW